MTIERDVQGSAPGVIVELLDIDATAIGGETAHIVSQAVGTVTWRGVVYAPLDFVGEGWKVGADGALPRPTVSVDNTRNALLDLVLRCSDLRGARVTRWKTLSRYLDGAPEADPEAWLSRDVWYVDQKKAQEKRVMTFELRSPLDLAGRQIPARQVLRDWCSRRYRWWNAASASFVYADEETACPYAGAACFDADGDPASPENDACPKTRAACMLRFGRAATLPTWSFFGVARERRS